MGSQVITARIVADRHWSFPLQVVRGTARQLRDHFPGVTVLPALGNHESVPVDSFPQPSVTGDPGRETISYWLSLLETWRYVLALHYSGGGVGRVVGRGAQLDNQVRHETLFVWKNDGISDNKLKYENINCKRVYFKKQVNNSIKREKLVFANSKTVSLLIYPTALCKLGYWNEFAK